MVYYTVSGNIMDSCECGKRSDSHEYPFFAWVKLPGMNCAGSLINNLYALTAAMCLMVWNQIRKLN